LWADGGASISRPVCAVGGAHDPRFSPLQLKRQNVRFNFIHTSALTKLRKSICSIFWLIGLLVNWGNHLFGRNLKQKKTSQLNSICFAYF